MDANRFDTISKLFADRRLSRREAMVKGGTALAATGLAAAGISGVVSYVVVQRTREIGVRVALGARPSTVRRMIVTQGAWPVIGGWVIGLPLALLIALAMGRAFAFVTASDPANYLAVLGTIALIALAACCLPARLASRVDPVIALRAE